MVVTYSYNDDDIKQLILNDLKDRGITPEDKDDIYVFLMSDVEVIVKPTDKV